MQLLTTIGQTVEYNFYCTHSIIFLGYVVSNNGVWDNRRGWMVGDCNSSTILEESQEEK
jgi:hypothetical protein